LSTLNAAATEWPIRAASPADKPAVLELINLVQPHLPWRSEDYDWQLLQGPAGPAEVRIIEAAGRVVSLYVGTRKHLWVNGKVQRGIMVQDVLTHPEFRGRGFLNGMAASFLSEMRAWGDYGYTFPNKLSENSFRRTGWTELTGIPALQQVLPAGAQSAPRAALLSEIASFDRSIDDIWPNAGISIGVLRNADYLGWRYGKPRTQYRRFRIKDGAGLLVLKLYDRGDAKVMHVCDLVLRAEARALCGSVLAEVRALAREAGATLLTAWLTQGHPYRQTFEAAGLAPDLSNDRFAFVTGPQDILPQLAAASSWHLSQGDSDVY
jgi:GNAT superfamily N-acetyltransferase